MKKLTIFTMMLLISIAVFAQKEKTEKVVYLDSAQYREFMTIRVHKVKKNTVILKRGVRKHRVFRPSNLDINPGDKFMLQSEFTDVKKIKWEHLMEFPQ